MEINQGNHIKFGIEKHPDEIVPVRDSHLPPTLKALLVVLSCFFPVLSVDTGENGLRGMATKAGTARYGVSELFFQ